MELITVIPDKSISLLVKNILVFEELDNSRKTILPFFADGYPGLLFQETENGLFISPHNKQMPSFFLYGQTIKPIELIMTGSYKLIIFQLYPFMLKSFFNVVPQDLNDNCYNLEQLECSFGADTKKKLNQTLHSANRIKIISSFLQSIFQEKQEELDFTISKAIQKIITKKGQLTIGDLCNELHLTERTFERRFFNAVGVTAKQFARIIQFQQSLEQLTIKDFTKLTDIVYANGFADQSHFIKVFKAFTGKTPLAFKSQE
jgi:AraC-like DNA-binding protein